MNFRQLVTIRFFSSWYHFISPRTHEMPEHIRYRWYGNQYRFHQWIWGKVLKGETDPCLFDDFTDSSYYLGARDYDSFKKLKGSRLSRLFWYALAMLVHFRLSTAFWTLGGLFIGYIVVPIGTRVVLPLYEALGWAWAVWVVLVTRICDFLRSLMADE